MTAAYRYALYFAPDTGSAWERFGRNWFNQVSEAPRRYGFHATLKAPFRLAPGCTPDALLEELAAYCGTLQAYALPAMKIALLGDFLALVPAEQDARTEAIAAECVSRFDRFRAPLDADDLARRRADRLGARELELLGRWGYPHVFERFRFHLSLTGPMGNTDPARIATLSVDACRSIATLEPPRFDAICVFEEPQPNSEFRLLRRIAFPF